MSLQTIIIEYIFGCCYCRCWCWWCCFVAVVAASAARCWWWSPSSLSSSLHCLVCQVCTIAALRLGREAGVLWAIHQQIPWHWCESLHCQEMAASRGYALLIPSRVGEARPVSSSQGWERGELWLAYVIALTILTYGVPDRRQLQN